MTDNEIIKALRFCSDPDTCSDDCSFYVEDETIHECTTKLSAAALDLIKRKQERIEALEFLDGHRMYAVLGELEEYEKFYGSSDIKIGLRIAIDTLKKGIFR